MIIAGGRDYIPTAIDCLKLAFELGRIGATEIVCGMANGADRFGLNIGKALGYTIKKFPAEWEKHGKAAGLIRNGEMARYADILILYPGGRGTDNMKRQAEENGLKIIEIK